MKQNRNIKRNEKLYLFFWCTKANGNSFQNKKICRLNNFVLFSLISTYCGFEFTFPTFPRKFAIALHCYIARSEGKNGWNPKIVEFMLTLNLFPEIFSRIFVLSILYFQREFLILIVLNSHLYLSWHLKNIITEYRFYHFIMSFYILQS